MDSRYWILLKYRRRTLRKHQNFPSCSPAPLRIRLRSLPSCPDTVSYTHLDVYKRQALVIVRSTKDAGSFTLTASASGLSGGSVTVITTEDPDAPKQDGLISYAFVRDYSVKAGNVPILSTEATGLMADGTEITGTIAWDEIPAEYIETAGDYTINGTLTFSAVSYTHLDNCPRFQRRPHRVAAILFAFLGKPVEDHQTAFSP